MMEAILKIQNLYKHYEGIVAVNNANLSVMPGTITGIYGDNGAGKTTLFNLISGFEKPDSGSVFFEGKDITKKSVIYRSRLGMGRLFQIPRIFVNVTVLDNLLAAGNNHEAKYLHNYLLKHSAIKKNKIAYIENAKNILEQFHLSEKANLKAYELSVGEKKLLSLGCLLMNGARLLLLDEPLAGINEKMISIIKDIIIKLRRDGFTIIFIEHDKNILAEIADTSYEILNESNSAHNENLCFQNQDIMFINKYYFYRLLGNKTIKTLISKNDKLLKYLSKKQKNNKEIVLEAVTKNGNLLEYCSERLKNDYDVVYQAVNHSYSDSPLKFASYQLRSDKNIVLTALRQCCGQPYKYATPELLSNKEFVLEAISIDWGVFLKANTFLLTDRDIAIAAVNKNGFLLKDISDDLKNDDEVVTIAVNERGGALKYASDYLKDKREIVLIAVSNFGMALEYASERLKDDVEVVQTAVKNNGLALQFSSDFIRTNSSVVMIAVKSDGIALEYASEKLKDNTDIVNEAVRNTGHALKFVSERHRSNKVIVMTAVSLIGYDAFPYIDDSMKDDDEVIRIAKMHEIERKQYANLAKMYSRRVL